MPTALDRLHARVRANPLLQRFTLLTRILLVMGFVPTGLTKLLGQRFTLLPPEHPVGYFFEAMYRTGLYWRFLGLGQILAAVLLLFPRTATLGALLFLPIIANIFVITISLDFQGTPLITGLMLLAVLYLLCWDYDRLRVALAAVFAPAAARPAGPRGASRVGVLSERGAYAAFTLSGLIFFGATRSLVPREAALASMLAFLALAGVLAIVAGVAAWRA